MHVLFVCTANIARSPYAERQARLIVGDAIGLSSAGVPGVAGESMDEQLAALLRRRGGDSEGHVSRVLTEAVLETADLTLTFEFAQQMRILDRWPERRDRVLGLHQFAAALDRCDGTLTGAALLTAVDRAVGFNSTTMDVNDPHGRGRRAAAACAKEIDAVLDRIMPRLAGSAG